MSDELVIGLARVVKEPLSDFFTEHCRSFAFSGRLENRIRDWVIQAWLYLIKISPQRREEKKAIRSQHGLRMAKAMRIAEQRGLV